jgi:hypothetical protein
MSTDFNLPSELELVPLDEEDSHEQGSKAEFDEQSKPKPNEEYNDVERRSTYRRTHNDRRNEFRFEQKEDRRSGKDRRKGSWNSSAI